MPEFTRGEVSIYYEEYGEGYPLLLFAPGGMRSMIEFWSRAPFNPIKEFAGEFRVIAMDQRNAGKSSAPITSSNGWPTFTADHIDLLDHLGVQQTHIMGGCIGSSYCLGLLQAIPDRISAAVLQNPIGLSDSNRKVFMDMFDEWGQELKQARPDVDEAALAAFRDNMFSGEFVFSVSPDFVRTVQKPLLILAGNDQFHPTATAREIKDLAPNAELVLSWREPEIVAETVKRVRAFLQSHTPVAVK